MANLSSKSALFAVFLGLTALFAAAPPTVRAVTVVSQAPVDAATRARVIAAYGKLPLSFEPSVGQDGDRMGAHSNSKAQFLSRGSGYALAIAPDEAVLRLHRAARLRSTLHGALRYAVRRANTAGSSSSDAVVDMRLVGANATAKVVGLDPLPGTVNYLRGRDPKNWHTAIPTYARVKLEHVYPGIDLVYYGKQRRLEYDFVLAPGADPGAIGMDVSGLVVGKTGQALVPRIDRAGDLVIAAGDGEVRFHKPVVYQPAADASGAASRLPVGGQFKLDGERVSFQVAPYNRRRPLVIDPELEYSTYINNSAVDEVDGVIAVDKSGNAYVGAETDTTNYPTVNPYQANHAAGGDSDGVLLKLNPSGSALVYATYLGGSDEEAITGIAVDSAGEAVVMGGTCSTNFPVTAGAYQTAVKGVCSTTNVFYSNLFVTKFNAAGSALVASTYLGGSVGEFPAGIALDSSGYVYVTGISASPDYPVTPGVVQSALKGSGSFGYGDGVVTKLNPALSALSYSTYLGGSGDDLMTAIAVDGAGDAYVTGGTNSSDYPVTPGAFQTTFGGNDASDFGDAFVAELNPTATALVYSTYLGGSSADFGEGVAVDKAGDAYVAGGTVSTNFPVTSGAFQKTFGGAGVLGTGDAFVAEINPKGSALLYSTYVGGSADEYAVAIAVDTSGGAWVLGSTDSANFPTTTSAIQANYAGPNISQAGISFFSGDLFVLRLNPKGSALTFSTYLGGSGDEAPFGASIALDGTAGVYVTGVTTSTDYPTTYGAFNATCAGADCGVAYQQFVTKIRTAKSQSFP